MQRAPFAIPDCPRFAVSTQAYRHLPRFVLRFREGQRTTVEVTEEAVVSQTRKRDDHRTRNSILEKWPIVGVRGFGRVPGWAHVCGGKVLE